MCGRYYVDDATAREIERLVKEISGRSKLEQMNNDVFPSGEAAVLTGEGGSLALSWQRWGFPGFRKSQVIFNARAETVLEKAMFRESIQNRRAIVPCTWFYEWDSKKERAAFLREDEEVTFMAGFYKRFGEEERFIILTAAANESVAPVHGRMPVIIEPEAIHDWIFDEIQAKRLLKTSPVALKKYVENGCAGPGSLL